MIEHLATAGFDYDLPEERIAQEPVNPRDAARLLTLAPAGALDDRLFTDLPDLLRAGDLLVANHTRVRRARLRGSRENGGEAEVLVLDELDETAAACLVRPGRRLPPGARITLRGGMSAIVGEALPGHDGARRVEFSVAEGRSLADLVEALGEPPLPPYIRRPLADPGRYQTLHALGPPSSVAAPTAGLHFTPRVRRALGDRGIGWTTLALDVGAGTFVPIRSDLIADHRMHEERYHLPAATAVAVNRTRAGGGRVIAVGTTVARALETCAVGFEVVPGRGATRLFMAPGHQVRGFDGLLTNFHQPRSSLLVLLAAVVGSRWRVAYEHALSAGYRFLSFGDCMLGWVSR